jgi:hypothetical protein
MVASLAKIEQDLTALDQAVLSLAEELQTAYANYLKALGAAVQQQLIMASYHVCTEGYPEKFLSLPVDQRQHLQQVLRRMAKQAQEELLAQLYPPTVETEGLLLDDLSDETDAESILAEQPLVDVAKPSPRSLTPKDLLLWQKSLEEAIAAELHTVSHAANRTLQKAGILPARLPEPLLEAATKTESAESSGSTPNLLNLLVEARSETDLETPDSESTKRHTIIHIVAIHLRLIEIEFADASVALTRNQVRQLQVKLKSLGRDYQKKQQERAIAQAQAAWRSSWYDD